ncbi:hypothetical protein BaRGS_00003720 [Batillaria attramentaria]|uniref:PGG domain-containing protein n=1 Tax=Batillaria attramentaria TaxID=370345 RepID=A0ABD0M046_9CAEN
MGNGSKPNCTSLKVDLVLLAICIVLDAVGEYVWKDPFDSDKGTENSWTNNLSGDNHAWPNPFDGSFHAYELDAMVMSFIAVAVRLLNACPAPDDCARCKKCFVEILSVVTLVGSAGFFIASIVSLGHNFTKNLIASYVLAALPILVGIGACLSAAANCARMTKTRNTRVSRTWLNTHSALSTK